jgi:hypothetical protein
LAGKIISSALVPPRVRSKVRISFIFVDEGRNCQSSKETNYGKHEKHENTVCRLTCIWRKSCYMYTPINVSYAGPGGPANESKNECSPAASICPNDNDWNCGRKRQQYPRCWRPSRYAQHERTGHRQFQQKSDAELNWRPTSIVCGLRLIGSAHLGKSLPFRPLSAGSGSRFRSAFNSGPTFRRL